VPVNSPGRKTSEQVRKEPAERSQNGFKYETWLSLEKPSNGFPSDPTRTNADVMVSGVHGFADVVESISPRRFVSG